MSELQPNTSTRDSSLSDDSLLTDLAPAREGLPAGYRMRAEAHYVDDLTERSVGPVIRMISTHAIQAHHVRNRTEIEPLVRSIAAHGVLQPLLVRGDGPSYIVVAGRSRLEAAKLAGQTTVPCVIVDGSQADALAEADNLRCGAPSEGESDARVASAEGFRQNLRRHMTTIQTAMTLSTGDDAITRRVGFDLAQANAHRAGWMVDAQQLAEQAPLRGTGAVAVATVIDQVRKALAPEFRLAGVTLHVTFADGVGSDSVDEQVLGVGLTGALVALLPIVDLADRPVIQIRSARQQSSTTVEISCGSVSMPKDWTRRVFDESWSDRPGGWQALLGAVSARAAAERLGGEVAMATPPERRRRAQGAHPATLPTSGRREGLHASMPVRSGMPVRLIVSRSKSNSIITTDSLPTTQPSWPGSIATTCGALNSTTQPSWYSMWISPRTRNPTWACMHSSVPTAAFMSLFQWNPAG